MRGQSRRVYDAVLESWLAQVFEFYREAFFDWLQGIGPNAKPPLTRLRVLHGYDETSFRRGHGDWDCGGPVRPV